MTIGCNIWMICLKLNCCMLQFSQFVWTLSYSVWDVFNNFLLIDATDRSKISSDQKRFFIAFSLYPLSFFANTPFKRFFTFVLKMNFITVSIYSLASGLQVILFEEIVKKKLKDCSWIHLETFQIFYPIFE